MDLSVSEIKKKFDNVIEWSQNISNPKTDKLFDTWLDAKRDFIEAFGGRYIYEYPDKVAFELGEKEKHERVLNFMAQVENQWGYSELARFIEEQEPGFFQNITISDYKAWDGKIIKKGTRLVKAFKHFIENERSLADVQNEASRIIQEDKIEGRLCISVHPLDYLSLSENTYNWRSCHALDGEYRAGNLSYMMDKHTVVCYLKADKDAQLPNFPQGELWNDKKWRVLLYVSSDWKMIFAGRQYPFDTSVGMSFLLRSALPDSGICRSFRTNIEWSDWTGDLICDISLSNGVKIHFDSPYLPVGNGLIRLNDLVKDARGSKQFNDVLNSSCYSPVYSYQYVRPYWQYDECLDEGCEIHSLRGYIDETEFNIGAYTYCLKCGEQECLIGSDTMMCEHCELEYGDSDNDLFTTCDCCGRRVYTDDTYQVVDEWFCPDCYDRYVKKCENCGDEVHVDFIRYHEASGRYLCSACYEDIIYEEDHSDG